MSNVDKTIRVGIDDKGVGQSNDRIRKIIDDTHRQAVEASKDNKKMSQEEIDFIKKKLKLMEELNQKESESRRRKLDESRIGINSAQIDFEQMKEKRKRLEQEIPGLRNDPNWRAETEAEVSSRRKEILDKRKEYLDQNRAFKETRDHNNKQISELRNIVSSVDKGSEKTIRSNENTVTNIFRSLNSGSAAGFTGSLLGLIGGGTVGAMMAGILVSNAKEYQEGLRNFSVASQTPIKISQKLAPLYRDPSMGISGTEALNKESMFQTAISRYLMASETKGLIGAQLSRGFTDQQINQLLTISRYSGRSAIGTISDFENYTKETDRKNLLKLPETLELYLRTVNQILDRTGRVDAIGVQQSLMSIGKSYGVSGLQLDKTMSGLTQLSTLSDNPVLLALQQQAFRKLYPDKDPWEMVKMLQNPAEHMDLMKEIFTNVSGFGGGGMFTKMGMASLGLDPYTIDRLMGSELSVSPRGKEVTNSAQKQLENNYINTSKDFVPSLQKIETLMGTVRDQLNMSVSELADKIVEIFDNGGKYERVTRKAVEDGTTESRRKNPSRN